LDGPELSVADLGLWQLCFANSLLSEVCLSLKKLQRICVVAEALLERADGFENLISVDLQPPKTQTRRSFASGHAGQRAAVTTRRGISVSR